MIIGHKVRGTIVDGKLMLKKSKITAQTIRGLVPPDMPEMHQMLSQAMEKRGERIQVGWKSADKLAQFVLEVSCNVKGGDPRWCLYSELRGQRNLIVDYSSCDVLIVHNLIHSTCNAAAPSNAPAAPPSGTGIQIAKQSSSTAHAKALPVPIPPPTAIAPVAPAPKPPVSQQPPPPPPPSRPDAAAKSAPVQRPTTPAPHVPPPAAPKAPVPETPRVQPAEPKEASPRFPHSGEIKSVPLADLLKAIRDSQSTGKLEVRNKQTTALVYIQNGLPVDATAGEAEGDDAIIELLTWLDGQFEFESRVLRNSHTVHQTLEMLVAQSKQLQERMNYLREAGLQSGSTLSVKDDSVTDLEFVNRANRNAPIAVENLLKFYHILDGKQTVEQMARALPFSRIQLLGMIHHLVSNDLVMIGARPKAAKKLAVQPRIVDGAAIQSVMMSLRRADTGMFIYPAFLYFLEQEYFRCYRSRSSLSVLVFQMRVVNENGRQLLPPQAVMDAVVRISQAKRHMDLLAHYDAFDYAMLLPNTKSNGAEVFARKLVNVLSNSPLGGQLDGKLTLAFGGASIPEDFKDLSTFLGACDLALQQAVERKQSILMYRDLKSQVEG